MVEAVENLALRLAGTNGRGLRERSQTSSTSFTLMDLRLRNGYPLDQVEALELLGGQEAKADWLWEDSIDGAAVETVCYDVVFPGQIYQLCGKFGDKGQVPLLPGRDWSGRLEDGGGQGLVVW